MDQQQSAQEAKLCQWKVCILHSLTIFYTTYTNPYMCHFVDMWERESCSYFLRSGHFRVCDNIGLTTISVFKKFSFFVVFVSRFSLSLLLTLNHVHIIGTISYCHCDGGSKLLHQLHNFSLLPWGHPTTQHWLALVAQRHKLGAQLRCLDQFFLYKTSRKGCLGGCDVINIYRFYKFSFPISLITPPPLIFLNFLLCPYWKTSCHAFLIYTKSDTHKFKSINNNGSFTPLRHFVCTPNLRHFTLIEI